MADQYEILESYRAGKITKEQARELLDALDPQAPTLPGEGRKTASQIQAEQEAIKAREAQRKKSQSGIGFALKQAGKAFEAAAGKRLGIDPENIAAVSRFWGGEYPLARATGIPQTLTGATDFAASLGETLMGGVNAATALASEGVRQSGLGELLSGRELSPERSLAEAQMLGESAGIVSAVPAARVQAPSRVVATRKAEDVAEDAAKFVAKQSEPIVKPMAATVKSMAEKADDALVKIAIGGKDPKTVARGMVDDALKADKVDPAAINAPTRLQAGGEVTQALARTAGSRVGESRRIIEKYKERILSEQYPQVVEGMQATLGRGTGYFDDVDDLIKARTELSAPYYARAREQIVKVPDEIAALMKTPAGQKAYKNAKTFADNDNVRLPEFKAGEEVFIDDIDRLKRGFDQLIEGRRDKVTKMLPSDPKMDNLRGVRARYLKSIENLSDDYTEARLKFSGPSESLDALEMGSGFMNWAPEKIAARLKGMPEGNREFFRAGALKQIIDKLDRAGLGDNVVRKELTSRYFRNQLSAVIGNRQKAEKLVDFLISERQKAMDAARLSSRANSQTDIRNLERNIFSRAMDAFMNPVSGAANVARGVVGKIGGEKAAVAQQEVYDEIARLLTSEIIPPM